MREFTILSLILLCGIPAHPQAVPTGWKIIKDSKAACQIAVPPDWVPLGESNGAAVFHDPGTAIAVVTSQPDQAFKALPPAVLRAMGIPREKMFANDAKHVFYQDMTSRNQDDPNGFSASVPGKTGTCSVHVAIAPGLSQDLGKKIALSLAPVPGDKT